MKAYVLPLPRNYLKTQEKPRDMMFDMEFFICPVISGPSKYKVVSSYKGFLLGLVGGYVIFTNFKTRYSPQQPLTAVLHNRLHIPGQIRFPFGARKVSAHSVEPNESKWQTGSPERKLLFPKVLANFLLLSFLSIPHEAKWVFLYGLRYF